MDRTRRGCPPSYMISTGAHTTPSESGEMGASEAVRFAVDDK